MVITELAGGYGNLVTLENGIVRKQFKENQFTRVPLLVRKKREECNLRHFAGSGITPQLLGTEEDTIWMEYLEGENSLERTKRGEQVTEEAGRLLRLIHRSINRPPVYLRQSFERKVAFGLWRGEAILDYLGLSVQIRPNWENVLEKGTTRIHGDFWLANIIGGRVIDWEFGRIGSPYQDYAAMELWTFNEYGGSDEFWRGYGHRADQGTIDQYVKLECLDYLGDVSIENYKQEAEEGFYHQKARLLRRL